MSRSCCSAKLTITRVNEAEKQSTIWQPGFKQVNSLRLKPNQIVGIAGATGPDDVEAYRGKRSQLATAAIARYGEWGATVASAPPPDVVPEPDMGAQVALYLPRQRQRHKELTAYGWSNPNRLPSEQQRVEEAESTARSIFLRHPAFPKEGPSARNHSFSFMGGAYDYRAREPSKEVAGSVPILRVKPRTEAARVNAEAQDQGRRDLLSGSRWELDQKYGNPPANCPPSAISPFRQTSPEKWIAPKSGGFVSSFPSTRGASTDRYWTGAAFDDAQRQWGGSDYRQTTSSRWLHHTGDFSDTPHQKVEANLMSEKLKSSCSAHNDAERERERSFSPYVKQNVYVPSSSPLCTWNLREQGINAPSPPPPRTYHKSSHRSLGGPSTAVSAPSSSHQKSP